MKENLTFFQRLKAQMKFQHYLLLAFVVIVGVGLISVAAEGEAPEPEFTDDWQRLEYQLNNFKLERGRSIDRIQLNQHYEIEDKRIVLIHLNTNPVSHKLLLNEVRGLLRIMQPYQDIHEIAIFYASDGVSIMKYAIDGVVLRLQNLDHIMIDDLPKIASDYR